MELQAAENTLDPVGYEFYRRAIRSLQEAQIPFLVGGAYSLAHHTQIERHTKDFDVFVRRADCSRVLKTLEQIGCSVEMTHPHWLGKGLWRDYMIDVIFSSGNGVVRVDDQWFQNALEGRVFDMPVLLCPVEETIWSKSFVMERERYDGADIAHLIRASGSEIDWRRLLDRFGPQWRVLFAHLVLFGFIYPSETIVVPPWVIEELQSRLTKEVSSPPSPARICRGTLLSRAQYLVDIEHWGYADPRVPDGYMSAEQVEQWTAAIATEPPTPTTRPTIRE